MKDILGAVEKMEKVPDVEKDDSKNFEACLEYWAKSFKDVLPSGWRSRSLDSLQDSSEKSILRAYSVEQDDFGFLVMGKSGVGKTFVLNAFMNEVLEKAFFYKVPMRQAAAYFPIGYLLYRLRSKRDPEEFKLCLDVNFLFLDDLGTENTTDFAREHFFTILDLRCQKKKPTFITTNLSLNELTQKYGERVVSRLKEMGAVLEIKGDDKRNQILKDRISVLKKRAER